MGKGYFTLKKAAECSFTERKSEFIGNATPVKTEAEALEFINRIRSKYSDATHNVYAYILREGNLTRFSDDGEPHGTAGLPVLEVLRKEELCDCAVVVTRYFGGILLGAGGLVRAYSNGAKIGIDGAEKIFLKPFTLLEIETDYGRYNRIAQLMSAHGVRLDDSNFEIDVKLKASVAAERAEGFIKAVTDATNGIVLVRTVGEVYDYE
ncbi:MAG: YigZ family protein [Clostridia bacterium]|nr:YigZ family protein [Clostridia bacterium]MBQ7048334.1 YigZ family protein [Clostridia bacterium]